MTKRELARLKKAFYKALLRWIADGCPDRSYDKVEQPFYPADGLCWQAWNFGYAYDRSSGLSEDLAGDTGQALKKALAKDFADAMLDTEYPFNVGRGSNYDEGGFAREQSDRRLYHNGKRLRWIIEGANA